MNLEKEREKEIKDLRESTQIHLDYIRDHFADIIAGYENRIEYLLGEIEYFRRQQKYLVSQVDRICGYIDRGQADELDTENERSLWADYRPYAERK